jgi:hypothetical protein
MVTASPLYLYLGTQLALSFAWIRIFYIHFFAKKTDVIYNYYHVECLYTITAYCIEYTDICYLVTGAISTPALCILRSCTDDPLLTTFAFVVIHGLALCAVLVLSVWIGGIIPLVVWISFIVVYAINQAVMWNMPVRSNYLILDFEVYSSSYFTLLRIIAFVSVCFEFIGIMVSCYYVFARFAHE